jgi:hypothetical protein
MFKAGDLDPAFPMISEIIRRYELSREQQYWLCFIYAATYHNASMFLFQQEYPELSKVDIGRLQTWWDKNQTHFKVQATRNLNKDKFVQTVASYKEIIGTGTQHDWLQKFVARDAPRATFRNLFNGLCGPKATYKVTGFGPYAVFAWLEALARCAGVPLDCDEFRKTPPTNPRKGICSAFGLDYKTATDAQVDEVVEKVMTELKQAGLPVDYFYIETLACAFQNRQREESDPKFRYVGYYLDRMYDEIKDGETKMAAISTGVNWDTLWEMRREIFPHKHLKELPQ